jgi:hypothetical protein
MSTKRKNIKIKHIAQTSKPIVDVNTVEFLNAARVIRDTHDLPERLRLITLIKPLAASKMDQALVSSLEQIHDHGAIIGLINSYEKHVS